MRLIMKASYNGESIVIKIRKAKKWDIFCWFSTIVIVKLFKKYAILCCVRPYKSSFLVMKMHLFGFFDAAEILSMNSSWISQPIFRSWFSKITKVYSFLLSHKLVIKTTLEKHTVFNLSNLSVFNHPSQDLNTPITS